MAKTKQTARNSTGGAPPTAELARMAARTPSVRSEDRAEEHRWVMFNPSSARPWTIQPLDDKQSTVSFAEGDREIPRPIDLWCRANPGVALDAVRCQRWSLGMESSDGEEDEETSSSDDEITPASRSTEKQSLDVKVIQYSSVTKEYKGRAFRGQWFPLTFHQLVLHDDPVENIKQLMKEDDWCLNNPDKPRNLPIGWRSDTPAENKELTAIKIMYRSRGMNCVAMAAANLLARNDPRTARIVSMCDQNFNNLRRFAAWLNGNTHWGSRDILKSLETSSSSRPSPRSLMEHILSRDTGVFVVQLIDNEGNSSHSVGINCFNQTIHDCAEVYALVLSISSLSFCTGTGHKCVGFISAYKLEMKPTKGTKRSRNSNNDH
jgi:hypothetical protein